MQDISDFGKKPQKPDTCPSVASQMVTACLPVTISPYSVTAPAMIKCCGKPDIQSSCNRCKGKVNDVCEFTISQKIRVEIPVEFGAAVNIGDTYVDCGCVKTDDYDGDKHKFGEDD